MSVNAHEVFAAVIEAWPSMPKPLQKLIIDYTHPSQKEVTEIRWDNIHIRLKAIIGLEGYDTFCDNLAKSSAHTLYLNEVDKIDKVLWSNLIHALSNCPSLVNIETHDMQQHREQRQKELDEICQNNVKGILAKTSTPPSKPLLLSVQPSKEQSSGNSNTKDPQKRTRKQPHCAIFK
jgi:hypothetical protein